MNSIFITSRPGSTSQDTLPVGLATLVTLDKLHINLNISLGKLESRKKMAMFVHHVYSKYWDRLSIFLYDDCWALKKGVISFLCPAFSHLNHVIHCEASIYLWILARSNRNSMPGNAYFENIQKNTLMAVFLIKWGVP